MGKIKTWKNKIINHLVGFDNLLEIRTDFLKLYQVVLSHPHYRNRINPDSPVWYSKAIEVGAHSEYYNPHRNIIRIINLLVLISGAFFGTIGYLVWRIPIVGGLITITPIFLLKIYSKLLSLDAELIASINKKLALNRGALLKLKRRKNDEIVGAYIWNQSLNSPEIIPILLLLRLIKRINGRIYKIIIIVLERFIILSVGGESKKNIFQKLWSSRGNFKL